MNKIIFWTMAAMAFLLASCAGEEEVTTPADSLKGKPINVDVLVSDIKTRAGYDTDDLPTKFYLTIDQDGENYDYTNVVMKYEKGKWVAYDTNNRTATYEAILVPQTIAENTFGIEIRIGEKTYERKSAAAFTLIGGTNHILEMTVGNVSSANIN